MELIVMTTLCVLLLALLTPSASLQIHENANEVQHDSLPVLPRKIRLLFPEHQDKGHRSQDHFQTYNGQKEYVAGKSYDKDGHEVMVLGHGRQGTRQEWVEQGGETSPFYTMDYTHVRRRRHIHNKTRPDVAP